MFYLRFTEQPELDLQRATSIHATDYKVSEYSDGELAFMLDMEPDDFVEINGLWNIELNGLCGYQLESEDLEDAIDEVESNDWQFSFVGKPVIFEGEYVDNDVPDGDLFRPISIAKILN